MRFFGCSWWFFYVDGAFYHSFFFFCFYISYVLYLVRPFTISMILCIHCCWVNCLFVFYLSCEWFFFLLPFLCIITKPSMSALIFVCFIVFGICWLWFFFYGCLTMSFCSNGTFCITYLLFVCALCCFKYWIAPFVSISAE